MATNSHGVTALDFATVSGCDQLVTGPTHARGGTLDLLMTDVPDLVRMAVGAPLGSSDHSSLLTAISMAQVIPNLYVSRRMLLKHWVNWTDNPVERLDVHLSLLVERFVPTTVIRASSDEKQKNLFF